MHKPEITKINLSTTFPARARCKYCTEVPTLHYSIREPFLWFDPNRVIRSAWIEYIRKYLSKFVNDFYIIEEPKNIKTSTIFSYKPDNKYDPKIHKNKGVMSVDNRVEFLTCECGKSVWAFTDKSVVNRPEIVNRKARSTFTKKISSY